MKLQFTNTLSKKKEAFTPLITNKISLYVCGITPYDRAHLGHGRVYVNFDILVRLLRYLQYDVTYIRNYTDIDDKIIKRAQNERGDGQKYAAIAEKYIDLFKQDLRALNCLTPTAEPRVTECIDPIIEFTRQLVAKGNAYVIEQDVYFDISTFYGYGKLSGKKIDELEAGSRVDLDTRKKNPGDFALWKGNKEGLFWSSPWGHGRPGWHIECSVMAKKHLGETIDIHGGGSDLMFPHHENEIAQSEGLHDKPFATFWLHNAFVNINKEKMSKSLGNMINLNDIFQQTDPMVLRYYYLQHHYRTPIDFSLDDLKNVIPAYKRLINVFEPVQTMDANSYGSTSSPRAAISSPQTSPYPTHSAHPSPEPGRRVEGVEGSPILTEMLNALCDDLNTPKFLGLIFQNLDIIQKTATLAQHIKSMLQNILGLTLAPLIEETVTITPEIQQLIDERETARQLKDWQRSDLLRDKLVALGIDLHDKKAR